MRPALQWVVRAWASAPQPHGASVTVIGYHRIGERSDAMTVRPATFAAHLGWLAEQGDRLPVVPVGEAVRPVVGGRAGRAVAVTVDDAWADVHENGLAVVAATRLPVTLYVPSRLLGNPGYMTAAQVRECVAAGMTVGAHSRSHPDLRSCDDGELEAEVRGSREDLEDLLGARVDSFAYPSGLLDRRVRDAVVRAGFADAVTTRRGWARPGGDPFAIPRSIVEDFGLPVFRAAVGGGLNALRPLDALRSLRRRGDGPPVAPPGSRPRPRR